MKVPCRSLLLLVTLVWAGAAAAQPVPVTVDATGEVRMPADRVILQINITVSDSSPETAFQNHKTRESALVSLIRENGIDSDRLRFQPVTIGATWDRNNERLYRTGQQVRLTIDDFSLFEETQLFLIENGFDSFSGVFGTSRQDEGESRSLEQAIENAGLKAGIIAASLDKTVRAVTSVEHGSSPVVRGYNMESVMMRADGGSLMEFEQEVVISSSVTVTYLLE